MLGAVGPPTACRHDVSDESGVLAEPFDVRVIQEAVHNPATQLSHLFDPGAFVSGVVILLGVARGQYFMRFQRCPGRQRRVAPTADRGADQVHGVSGAREEVAKQETVQPGDTQKFGSAGCAHQGVEQGRRPALFGDPLARRVAGVDGQRLRHARGPRAGCGRST